jgi:uncharacterized protein (TIGR03435 family)
MRTLALLIACAAPAAFCQPSFLAASLKTSDADLKSRPMIMADPGRIQYTNVTLRTMLTRAYGLKDYQVKGPDWVSNQLYSLVATMPPDTPDAAFKEMFQRLLEERFQLKLRRTSEEMPVYALIAGKGAPKLTKAEGGDVSIRTTGGAMRAKNASMWNLSNMLGGLLDRPVIDQTGIEGQYDFTLEFGPDATLGPGMRKMSMEASLSGGGEAAPGQSIFTAIQQLGLKLDAKKAPVEVLIVESGSKVPVEN